MKILKTVSLGSNFTGSYIKKSVKHFVIKKTEKALTGNTVNNYHAELYLMFLNVVVLI